MQTALPSSSASESSLLLIVLLLLLPPVCSACSSGCTIISPPLALRSSPLPTSAATSPLLWSLLLSTSTSSSTSSFSSSSSRQSILTFPIPRSATRRFPFQKVTPIGGILRSITTCSSTCSSRISRNMATIPAGADGSKGLDDHNNHEQQSDTNDTTENDTGNNDNNNNNNEEEGSFSSVLSDLGLSTDRPLLLGSASFTRKLILQEMGVPFVKLVRPIDEKALGDRTSPDTSPRDLVLLLAGAKMDHLVHELTGGRCDDDLPKRTDQNDGDNDDGWILLTGDQVVTCQGRILEKPESVDEARDFLRRYGQSPPSTVGSCVIHHHPSGIRVAGVDTATIHFRPTVAAHCGSNDDDDDGEGTSLVDRLVEAGEPVMSCAGGLMIEHPLVQEHVERIDGTVDSVMGLSKDLVRRLLEELSIQLGTDGKL